MPSLCCHAAAVAVVAVRFECIDRLVQGLSALFLALRRRPIIRYQKTSSAAQRLAEGLYGLTYKQQVCMCGRMHFSVCRKRSNSTAEMSNNRT